MQNVGHSQHHGPVKLLKAFQASGTQVCSKADYQGISDSSLSICQSLHGGASQTFGKGKTQQDEVLASSTHHAGIKTTERASMGMCTFLWVHMEEKREDYRSLMNDARTKLVVWDRKKNPNPATK